MNFLVDAQLPPALARWIATKTHQAVHVFDLGFHTADDSAIWEHAAKIRAVIITKDADFVHRWLLAATPVPVIWIRKGNCSNRALIAWLASLWPRVEQRLESGELFIELQP